MRHGFLARAFCIPLLRPGATLELHARLSAELHHDQSLGWFQVNDFGADALVSQLLLLDSQAPNKVDVGADTSLCRTPCDPQHVSSITMSQAPVRSRPCCHRSRCPCAQDIKLFINSPGGSVTAGMGIYDAMQVPHA